MKNNAATPIPAEEILRRRDMRDVFKFTIDPADAKDFDDALSFERMDEGFRIGVHIADVSFYVKPGSKEDEDAYRRGTSVYLVDRVLPMLPERLCNNLCSLRPHEDKLCMSVIFTFSVPTDAKGLPRFAEARVIKHKICRTVIRSDFRLNYAEALQILKGKEPVITPNQTGETLSRENRVGINSGSTRGQLGSNSGASSNQIEFLSGALTTLNALALQLRAARMANGALDIEQPEMRFRLDKNNHPTEIYFEEPDEAHHLIEEFMLLANRTVARAVGSGRPFVYRVHDLPNQEKLDNLRDFTKHLGNRIPPQVLEILTIRAQAKAVYSTRNIGHYGLAFTHYTHFTSPIRRYPDLMVHRLVDKYILTGKPAAWTQQELQDICDHCSACEQDAVQAERDSIKLFQAMFMADHLGETLPGHISGVTDFGLFIQLDETHCEGLVHISTIGNNGEYWQYDEKNYRLVCENHPPRRKKRNDQMVNDQIVNSYTLGDPVMVKVIRVDENRAQIDFLLV